MELNWIPNAAVVWVGRARATASAAFPYGDGEYRSDDGGKSWKNLGLKKSGAHRPHCDRPAR